MRSDIQEQQPQEPQPCPDGSQPDATGQCPQQQQQQKAPPNQSQQGGNNTG